MSLLKIFSLAIISIPILGYYNIRVLNLNKKYRKKTFILKGKIFDYSINSMMNQYGNFSNSTSDMGQMGQCIGIIHVIPGINIIISFILSVFYIIHVLNYLFTKQLTKKRINIKLFGFDLDFISKINIKSKLKSFIFFD